MFDNKKIPVDRSRSKKDQVDDLKRYVFLVCEACGEVQGWTYSYVRSLVDSKGLDFLRCPIEKRKYQFCPGGFLNPRDPEDEVALEEILRDKKVSIPAYLRTGGRSEVVERWVAVPLALDGSFESKAQKRGKTWRRQERRVAGKLDGDCQVGSGNQPFKRGDVKACTEDVEVELLVECKSTDKMSMKLEAAWLDKITKEALSADKEPALSIEIKGVAAGTPRDWTMVPTEILRQLLSLRKID